MVEIFFTHPKRTLFLIALITFFCGMIFVELYMRYYLGFKMILPELQKQSEFVPYDKRKSFNRLYVATFPERLKNWPIKMETFDPGQELEKPLTRPAYLFKKNAKYKFVGNKFIEAKEGEKASWSSNSLGFRDKEFALKKPEGVFRIVCLGSSATEGSQGDDETYPYYLERELSRLYPSDKIEVINGGFGGYGSNDFLAIFESKILVLDPDLIIYYEVGNNVDQEEFVIDKKPAEPVSAAIFGQLYGRSVIFRLLGRALGLPFPKRGYEYRKDIVRPSLDFYIENLSQIIEKAKSSKTEIVLASPINGFHAGLWTDYYVPPSLYWMYEKSFPVRPEDIDLWYRDTGDRIAQLAREQNVRYFDLAGDFPKDSRYFAHFRGLYDPNHFSPEGNQLLASLLSRELSSEVLPKLINERK